MDRQCGTGSGEQAVPGIHRAQEQRRECGMPVVRMDHVRREWQPLAGLQRRARQQQKSPVLVGTAAVEACPVVELRAIDKIQREVSGRIAGLEDRIGVAMGAELEDQIAQSRHGSPLDGQCQHRAVGRNEGCHSVAHGGQVAGQRADHVGEATGFRQRRVLGRNEADLQRFRITHRPSIPRPNDGPTTCVRRPGPWCGDRTGAQRPVWSPAS